MHPLPPLRGRGPIYPLRPRRRSRNAPVPATPPRHKGGPHETPRRRSLPKSARIDPPVEGVSPSLNRCVEARPERDTHYTLTTEGADGHAVSESLSLRVVPDPGALPKIAYFRIAGRQKDYLGRTIFSLSFASQNAEEVSIDPPVFHPLHGAPSGQFYVMPDKTTTYTLSVAGKHGNVARQPLTVEVPER